MRGYTDKALIIMPKPENYENKDEIHKLHIRECVRGFRTLIEKVVGARTLMLLTDEVALDVYSKDSSIGWICTLPEADLQFAKNNLPAFGFIPSYISNNDYNDEAVKKYPVPIKRKLTKEERFKIAERRNNFIAKKFIQEFKLVMCVGGDAPAFKLYETLGKDRAVFNINPRNYVVGMTYMGAPMDIAVFTTRKETLSPAIRWEDYIK